MKQIITFKINRESGIENSLGEHQTEAPYLEFLLRQHYNSIMCFCDLDNDVATLLALLDLTPKQLEKLNETKNLILESNIRYEPYILNYIPKKWFSIDKGKIFNGFCDLSQYDQNLSKPEATIEQAQKVAEEAYQAFLDLELNPKNLISPINIYRKSGLLNNLELPWFDDIPLEAMEMAYKCCKGSWVESFAIGKWEKVYDYDINSAYPFHASQLLNLRLGTWKQSKEYQPTAYGYCHCKVNITSNFSPIICQFEDRNYTPKGTFLTWLTKNEIEFINDWHLGTVEILDGWWFFPDEIKLPLEIEMKLLYEHKAKATGLSRDIIKRIMSGIYGLFIETQNEDFGDYFLSPYAAEIESRTRLQLASVCLENHIVPLHIAVDGLVTDKMLDMGCAIETFGSWRLEHEAVPAIICSSGLVCIDTKTGKGDFAIQYPWLAEQIANNPKAKSYSLSKQSVLSLAQAAKLGRIKDVGKLETIERSVEYSDNKRYYQKLPANFGELSKNQYYSEAWPFGLLQVLEREEEK